MSTDITVAGFTVLDAAGLALFFVGWLLYTWFADHSRYAARGLPNRVEHFRERWMRQMVQREARMIDLLILGNLVRGIAFFASTAILLVGGLLAVLGASDKAVQAMSELPFSTPTPVPLWELKVLVLLGIFVYAFVKFVWAFRLTNYASILVGAAPAPAPLTEGTRRYAREAAVLTTLAGRHFNRGLRANFMALAMLGWFLHPGAFMVATVLILWTLYRREFRSRSLAALNRMGEEDDAPRPEDGPGAR